MLIKILEIFTEQYRADIRHQMFLEEHIDELKLKDKDGDIDDKISRLKGIGDIPVFLVNTSHEDSPTS